MESLPDDHWVPDSHIMLIEISLAGIIYKVLILSSASLVRGVPFSGDASYKSTSKFSTMIREGMHVVRWQVIELSFLDFHKGDREHFA